MKKKNSRNSRNSQYFQFSRIPDQFILAELWQNFGRIGRSYFRGVTLLFQGACTKGEGPLRKVPPNRPKPFAHFPSEKKKVTCFRLSRTTQAELLDAVRQMRTTTRAQKRKREVAADHVCGIPEHLWVTIASKIDPYDDAAFSMTNKLFRRVLAEAKGTTTVAIHVEKARLLEDPPAYTPSWFRWAYSSPNLRPGGPAGCRDSEEDGNNSIIYQWDLLRLASFLGSVESLEWLMKQRIGIYGETRTCEYAALGGSLDALKWLRKKHFAWDKRTCKAAAESGNLGVLQWARANGCHWTVATCSEAAAEGHLEVLKWARSQNPPCPWDEYTASSAAGEGHFETLKWALSQVRRKFLEEKERKGSPRTFPV